jgi:hypothetical protein
MRSQLLHQDDEHHRTFAIAFDKGEEPFSLLTQFAREHALRGSQLTAIGAFERATLGYFDRRSKSYRRIAVDEQAEVLSFLGDVAHAGGEPVVHVHVVLGLADGTTRGGHLLDASVWPTLELVITEWPKYLCKRSDPEVGLHLLPGSAGADPR